MIILCILHNQFAEHDFENNFRNEILTMAYTIIRSNKITVSKIPIKNYKMFQVNRYIISRHIIPTINNDDSINMFL